MLKKFPRSVLTASMKKDPSKAQQFRRARIRRITFQKHADGLNLMSPTLEKDLQRIQRIVDSALVGK